MNQSPNTRLGESIRFMNSDFSDLDIITYNNENYITESSILSFMNENNLSGMDNVIAQIKEVNNIKNLTLLDESIIDENLVLIKDVMYLYESLKPFEVAKVAKGSSTLQSVMTKMISIISKDKDYEVKKLDAKIKHCDKVLKDIEEEKEKIKEHKSDDHIKFSFMFLYKIAKGIFRIFILPIIIKEKLKLPQKILNFFINKNKDSAAAQQTVAPDASKNTRFKSVVKIASVASTTADCINTFPQELYGLYMSFKGYNKLLDEYSDDIKNVKRYYLKMKSRAEHNKKGMISEMVEFDEITTDKEDAKVFYQTPEELRAGVSNDKRVVVHDDNPVASPAIRNDQPMELPTPQFDKPDINVQIDPPAKQEPVCSSPLDAVRVAQTNPCNVPVAKYGDKYYIDLYDLKCFMDSCGETKYESALNKIIKAHEDTDICSENVVVIMGENDISMLDPQTRYTMESSDVQFEVYSSR